MITDHHQALLDNARMCLTPIEIRLIGEVNDVEKSRSGNNHVFHHCELYEGRQAYAACLHTMDRVMEGDERIYQVCTDAIRSKTCPAMKMRMEELKANRTLFYVDHAKLTEHRAAQNLLDLEESPIKFGRRRREGANGGNKFKPTVFSKEELRDKKQPAVAKNSEGELDFNENIFEKVANKVLNDGI